MSVTPTLAAMLSDPLLQYRYVRHIDNLIALAAKEGRPDALAARIPSPGPHVPLPVSAARDVFVKQYNKQHPVRFSPVLRDGQNWKSSPAGPRTGSFRS